MDTVDQFEENRQRAPYPSALASFVNGDRVKFREGWTFDLVHIDRGQGSEGLTLRIVVNTPDSYGARGRINVAHFFPVPPASYNERTWRRWLFDRCCDVDRHEAMEFFEIDGVKWFGPHHADGNDPYTVHEVGTIEQTRFAGGERDPNDC